MSIRALLLLLGIACLGLPIEALAEPPVLSRDAQEARELFYRGLSLSEEARWADALEAFERSFALVQRPSTQYNLANALFNLGRAVEAEATITSYLESAEASEEPAERIAAAHELAALARQRRVTLRVHVSPEDATLTLDGREVPGAGVREVRVDPGDHVLRVTMVGYAPVVLRGSYPAGSHAEPELSLTEASPAPLAPPKAVAEDRPAASASESATASAVRSRRIRWALFATSAVTLAAGTGVGISALLLSKRVEAGCTDGSSGCDLDDESTATRAQRLAYGADVLLATGAASGIAALVFHWVAPRLDRRAEPVVSLAPGTLGAGLRLSLR